MEIKVLKQNFYFRH